MTRTYLDPADAVRAGFRDQAADCAEMGSPFTSRLCRVLGERMDDTNPVFARILSWPGDPWPARDAVPMRLCGALHELVLAGDDVLRAAYPPNDVVDDSLWSAILDALYRHEGFVLARLESAPQTNEVRRSAVLLPGLLEIARGYTGLPFVTSEIGASAGLNMNWDRYCYRLGPLSWGDPESPVLLSLDWRGGPPPAAASLTVTERAGCDLDPLPVNDESGRRRLLAYIWADQADRLARARAALQVRARHPLTVERADAVDWLHRRLAMPRLGAVHVVYHTIMWQYLPAESQAAGETFIRTAGARATAEAPLAWLRFEGDGSGEPGAALRLATWPGGTDRRLARADFHGRWIEWLPDSIDAAGDRGTPSRR